MPAKYELKCRLCDNNRETFESVDEANNSEWTNISPLGSITSDNVSTHNAYCPAHSIDDE